MSLGGFPSIGDYYRRGPYRAYARECRTAGRPPVDLVRVSQPAGSFPDPPLPALSLFLVTRGAIRTRVSFGDRPFTRLQRPGTFLVAPPDTACEYDVSAPHELLVVAIPLAAAGPLVQSAGLTVASLAPLHADAHHDPFVEQLCHRLFEEAAADSPLGKLFADHAIGALLAGLLRLAGRQLPRPRRPQSLPAAPLRRVLDYLDANLAGAVSLADLAAVARVSVFHFARQFRAAVGEAPHRYLIRLRVERAKGLIREGRLSLAQVAAAVGFADQSHLNRHFKRLAGVTPGQFLPGGG
jgi:AraC family transcriptional regulator